MRALLLATAIFSVSALSYGADGVLEINQTCAAGGGCFPGDDPGFPVRILNSGSYILTSNLVVPALENGITSLIGDAELPSDIAISVDLNGFTISSTTTCTNLPLECTTSTTETLDGNGILFAATGSGSFHVFNGAISGMANTAVLCSGACSIRDLIVSQNGNGGIRSDGTIVRVLALRNGGMRAFHVPNDGNIQNCTARQNAGVGFFGQGNYTNNFALFNEGGGFDVVLATMNGNTIAGGNTGTGVTCDRCSAHNNTIEGVVTGIDFNNDQAIYGGNLIDATTSAVVDAGNATQSYANSCEPTPCP